MIRGSLLAAGIVATGILGLISLRLANLWWLGRIGWYTGEWIEVDAAPEAGFDWPYRMYVPREVADGERPARIWLRPNNTSVGPSDDFAVHHADAAQLLAVSRQHADALGAVVLVPSFPRPGTDWHVYTHALDRDTMLLDGPMGRLDLDLLAMADDAIRRLDTDGIPVCEGLWIDGFSASGMFANRFTLVHPERVSAAAIGAPGGWPMVPVAEDGRALTYPVGTADFATLFGRPFPAEAAARTPTLFYLGSEDANDSVPYADAHDEADAAHIMDRYGATPAERWDDAEALFAGTAAEFRLHDGVGHWQDEAMVAELRAFLAAHDDRSACVRRP